MDKGGSEGREARKGEKRWCEGDAQHPVQTQEPRRLCSTQSHVQ